MTFGFYDPATKIFHRMPSGFYPPYTLGVAELPTLSRLIQGIRIDSKVPDSTIVQLGTRISSQPDIVSKPEAAQSTQKFTPAADCATLFVSILTWYDMYVFTIPALRKWVINDINFQFSNPYMPLIMETQVIVNGKVRPEIPATKNRKCWCPYPGGNIPIYGKAEVKIQARMKSGGWVKGRVSSYVLGWQTQDSLDQHQRTFK